MGKYCTFQIWGNVANFGVILHNNFGVFFLHKNWGNILPTIIFGIKFLVNIETILVGNKLFYSGIIFLHKLKKFLFSSTINGICTCLYISKGKYKWNFKNNFIFERSWGSISLQYSSKPHESFLRTRNYLKCSAARSQKCDT